MAGTSKSLASVLPWKVRTSLALLGNVTDFSRRSNGTINRRLFKIFDIATKTSPQSTNTIKTSDITIDSTRNLWFRLFKPVHQLTESTLPVFIFFHGGGFSFLSPDLKVYDAVCRRFALEVPAVVVSVGYRLSPEHKYPAAFDDGFDTLKFLDDRRCGEFPVNADLSRCFLGGDSAGANLAHHVAKRVVETQFDELKVKGLIAIQPFFGGEERTESEIRITEGLLVTVERTDWYWKTFLPQGSNRDHEAVNVFGPNGADLTSLTNFPPTLVFVGGFDPLQDWQRRYYQGLKRSGKKACLIEYPNGIHAFYFFPELPETSLLFNEVIVFINSNGKVK